MKFPKKTLSAVVLIICLALTFSAVAFAKDLTKEPDQTNCPVLSNPVNKDIYIDYKGKRIYFCCPPCINAFKKDPEKFMKQFEKQGVALEDAPQQKTK